MSAGWDPNAPDQYPWETDPAERGWWTDPWPQEDTTAARGSRALDSAAPSGSRTAGLFGAGGVAGSVLVLAAGGGAVGATALGLVVLLLGGAVVAVVVGVMVLLGACAVGSAYLRGAR